jgi:hypothetical protein
MTEQAGVTKRYRRGWKVLLGLGLAAPVLAGATLLPPVAAGGQQAAAHVHDSDAKVQVQLAQVRAATAGFHRVEQAVQAGYELGWVNGSGMWIVNRCVSHPTAGAMGYHYFNKDLVADPTVNALEPEVLVYAPDPDGVLELAAVEWIALSAQSDPAGVDQAPSVLGMEMHILAPPPGPAFYLTHAWIWKANPSGMFADWNPDVRC